MPRLTVLEGGIAIYMYGFDNDGHKAPHFHAVQGGRDMSVEIATGKILAGRMTRRQERTVRNYAASRQADLTRAWADVAAGRHPGTIEP